MKRKTYTSPEVKNRWNAAHYDRVAIVIPKGGADELRRIAEEKGMSVSAYIRALVIRDCADEPEKVHVIGGGYYLKQIAEEIQRDAEVQRYLDMMQAIMDGADPHQLHL